MEIIYAFSITDIIQSIGIGLGFPIAIWSIIKLFKKDKEKESQIKSLNNISKSQNDIITKMIEQINELSKQTQQFEYQSFLLKESNDLFKNQIKIQNDALISDKNYKEKSIELEKKKRKSKIKPFFRYMGGRRGAGATFMAPLTNYGERAYIIGIEEISTENINIEQKCKQKCTIEKNQIFQLQGNSKNNYIEYNVPFEINIIFKDEDGNKYKQNIKRQDLKMNVGMPEEI